CLFARYDSSDSRQYGIRFQATGHWLKPTDARGAEAQTFIGTWERIRFRKLVSPANDGNLHYGDTLAVVDRWGRFLSGRDNNDVTTMDALGPWERWIVESPDTALAPDGSRVPINWPLRLRSETFGKRLVESTSNGDIFINAATGASHLRINGPLYIQ